MNQESLCPFNTYLEFGKTNDYLEHLRTFRHDDTRCELSVVLSDGEALVYGVLSALIGGRLDGKYIAVCGVLLIALPQDIVDENVSQIVELFEDLKKSIIKQGFKVVPGIRKYEPPSYIADNAINYCFNSKS